MIDDIVKRLREPPFGTETSERNIMNAAADEIERLRADFAAAQECADKCKNYTDEDYVRLHKAHCYTSDLKREAERQRDEAADEIEQLRAENERLREALTPKVDDTLEELANRLWSVHPKTVQDSGLTRRQWYAREIENYFVIARAALEEKK